MQADESAREPSPDVRARAAGASACAYVATTRLLHACTPALATEAADTDHKALMTGVTITFHPVILG